MIRRHLCLFLVLLSGSVLWAQPGGYTVKSQHFLPPQYYVGDSVELRIRLSVDPSLEVTAPAELPVSDWVEIESVRIGSQDREPVLHIRFVPFQSGLRTLPTLVFGDLVLDGTMVHTASLVEEGHRELVPFADQMTLPGTGIWAGLILAGVFVGPILLILLIHGIRHRWFGNRDHRKKTRSFRLFLKGMKELSGKVGVLSSRELYTRLLDLFRTYLTDRTGEDYLTVTTREMPLLLRRTLPKEAFTKELNWGALRSLIESSDIIKFGGRVVPKEKQKKDLAVIHQVVAFVEQVYRISERARGEKKK